MTWCPDCKLGEDAQKRNEKPVWGEGNYTNGVMFVAEAPGCFLGGTPLTSLDGSSLVENDSKYTLDHSNKVLKNLSFNVENMKVFNFRCVKYPYYVATYNHEILIRKRKSYLRTKLPSSLEPFTWTSLEEVYNEKLTNPGIKHYLCVPKIQHTGGLQEINIAGFKKYKNRVNDNKLVQKVLLTKDLAFLLGCYMGDGGSDFKDGSVQIHISKGYKEKYLMRIIGSLSLFGLNPKVVKGVGSDKNITISVYSRTLVNIFKKLFGENCYTKRIPKIIFKSSKEIISEFLFGWYTTDGSHKVKSFRGSQNISSVSKLAVWDGVSLGLKCGVLLGVAISKSRKLSEQDIYYLNFDSSSIQKLGWGIPFKSNPSPNYGEDENYFYLLLTKINESLYTGVVYDKTTTKHYYHVPFVVHNSTEVAYGRPLIGISGKLFNRTLELHNINRSNCWVDNICHCRPSKPAGGNRTPKKEEIETCKHFIIEKIKALKPKLIVCLGGVAMKAITGMSGVEDRRGYFRETELGLVLSTYHPSAVLQDKKFRLLKTFINDIGLVAKFINNGYIPKDIKIHICKTESDLTTIKNKIFNEDVVAVDIETGGVDINKDTLTGISVAFSEFEGYWIDTRFYPQIVFNQFLKTILSSKIRKITSGNFDYKYLTNKGYEFKNWSYDTVAAHHLVEETTRHGLKSIAPWYVEGIWDWESGMRGVIENDETLSIDEKTKCLTGDYSLIPPEILGHYSVIDAVTTFCLYKEFSKKIQELGLEDFMNNHVMRFNKALTRLEQNSIIINREKLETARKELLLKRFDLEKFLLKTANINFESPKQVSNLLYQVMGLRPVKMTPLNVPSVCETVLQKHKRDGIEIAGRLLELKEINTQLKMFLGKPKKEKINKVIDIVENTENISNEPDTDNHKNDTQGGLLQYVNEKDELYPHYLLTGTVTGRLASLEPNLQNIPPFIRGVFMVPAGYKFVAADYKQAELFMLAYLSGDKKLNEILESGGDVHRKMAALVLKKREEDISNEERRVFKTVVFGMIYGRGATSTAEALGIPKEEAFKIMDMFFKELRGVKEWMEEVKQVVFKYGEIQSIYGRYRRFPELNYLDILENRAKGSIERMAVNYLVQSPVNETLMRSHYLLDEALKPPNRVIMTLHDELFFQIKEETLIEECNTIKRIMSLPLPVFNKSIAVNIEVGTNWGDLKPFN